MKLALCVFALLVPCPPDPGQRAGATFPNPIYSKWFDEYHKLHPDAQINYQSIGSGGGIRQLQAGTVDFGATDQPMNEEQLAKSSIKPLHFPTVLGAVVATYNLPGVESELSFTPRPWPGSSSQDQEVERPAAGESQPGVPCLRTRSWWYTVPTAADHLYLDRLPFQDQPEWKTQVGSGTSVNWPVGLGRKAMRAWLAW